LFHETSTLPWRTHRIGDAVYVLHAFQKKTQATPKREMDIAKERFSKLIRGGK
jgi:phage-related protein